LKIKPTFLDLFSFDISIVRCLRVTFFGTQCKYDKYALLTSWNRCVSTFFADHAAGDPHPSLCNTSYTLLKLMLHLHARFRLICCKCAWMLHGTTSCVQQMRNNWKVCSKFTTI